MPDYSEIEANIARLQSQLNTFAKELEPLELAVNEARTTKDEAETAEQARRALWLEEKYKLELQVRQAEEARSSTQYVHNATQRELLEAKRELERLQWAENLKREEEKRKAEAMASYDKWDMLTMGAKWREHAKDYQIKGAHFMTENRKVILADPMGLGKTLSAIITCDMAQAATLEASPDFPILGEPETYRRYQDGQWIEDIRIVNSITHPVGKKILYLCPAPLIKNVEREWREWTKDRNITFIGGMTKAERQFVFDFVIPNHEEYVIICNYEAWRKDNNLINELTKAEFDTLIFDEAHIVKEMKTSAFRGVQTLIEYGKFEYILPMTGTPILNRPHEIFSILHLINPKEFYALNTFLTQYCRQNAMGKWEFKPGGLDLLFKKIGNNILRRTRDQAGIELPEKTVTIHELEIDNEAFPEQAKVRKQMREYAQIIIDEAEGKAVQANYEIVLITRLRQIETWPAGIKIRNPITKEVEFGVDVEQSQKIDYIIHYDEQTKEYEGLLPNIVEDDRVIIFSQMTAPLEELRERIEKSGKRVAMLTGDTPTALREEIHLDFNRRYTPNREDSKWDVLLCNYKVGGVGMNLTAATQMIILDEEWNPGKRDQAYDRFHRIGQTDPVTIHVLRVAGTIDTWMAGIIEHKEKVVDGFTGKAVGLADLKQALNDGLI